MLYRLLLIALLSLPALARADGLFVIELFTSQGCSSCPPADEMLGEYAQRDDVIALSFHVDYWDYLGWSDTLADPGHSARQKGYAMAAGHSMVYTPQMIINGQHHIRGHQPLDLENLYDSDITRPVVLEVSRQSDGGFVVYASEVDARDLQVLLVRFVPKTEVLMQRGENAGRTITYTNAVMQVEELTQWNGQSELSLQVETSEDLGAVILVQAVNHGPILAAARLE